MKTLTTGILSGLGRYIYENIGGIGLSRQTASACIKGFMGSGVDTIIHCAFNSKTAVNSDNLYPYFADNVLLTRELVRIPHKNFIFISSVDVYPKNSKLHLEEEVIKADSIEGIYGVTKLISEAVVKKYCKNHLILRPTTLLGAYSRKNTIIKMIENKNCALGLSGDSVFNYVLHSDILDFIKIALKNNLHGIYNVASAKNIVLREAAAILGKRIRFGAHKYNVGRVSNLKISGICPAFKKTSGEILRCFLKEWEK